jgi:tRNA/tmRNA/rRNA uracil-C5-methylase (TrmA/RlmC/RlmD family)
VKAEVGRLLTLAIEKPAAGGRMIARADGQIVLVSGAIPGERVSARVERVGKGVLYADVVAVEDGSPDRRPPFTDPLCGGSLYAHIAYPRQLEIKAQVIADAFGRIARLPLATAVHVARSRDDGYRMRARLHVRGGRVGFFREGSHELCDMRATRQLLSATCDTVEQLAAALRSLGGGSVQAIEVSENIEASERVVHLDAAQPVGHSLDALGATPGLTGMTVTPSRVVAGDPHVRETLAIGAQQITLRRHVLAFFQGNRHLLAPLVTYVAGLVGAGDRVIDLYAGAGLFSLAAAARGAHVVAVEGDRTSAADLQANASAWSGAIDSRHEPVEAYVAGHRSAADVVIVDPPRTGMSKEALRGALALGARRIVYVSCDVATLARDTRQIVDSGYALEAIDGFDLFPNTPHVECVVQFVRAHRSD